MRLFLLRLVSAYNFALSFLGSTFSVLWGLVGLTIGGFVVYGLILLLGGTNDRDASLWIIGFILVTVLFFGGRFLHRFMRALPGFMPPGVRTNAAGDARMARIKDVQSSGLWRRR